MALNDEQAKSIKEQLLKQVENFPEDKKEQVREYILGMNNQQLEDFLRKNKQMQEESGESDGEDSNGKCIMCLISSKKIEAQSIYEDADYLAVLELNPLSKGHIILIPKKHLSSVKELPKTAMSLAKKIGKHLIKKLSAEDVKISPVDELGHAIINIIPLYKDEKLDKRKSAKKEELLELTEKIGKIKSKKEKTEKKPEKEIKKLVQEIIKLPRRIP